MQTLLRYSKSTQENPLIAPHKVISSQSRNLLSQEPSAFIYHPLDLKLPQNHLSQRNILNRTTDQLATNFNDKHAPQNLFHLTMNRTIKSKCSKPSTSLTLSSILTFFSSRFFFSYRKVEEKG